AQNGEQIQVGNAFLLQGRGQEALGAIAVERHAGARRDLAPQRLLDLQLIGDQQDGELVRRRGGAHLVEDLPEALVVGLVATAADLARVPGLELEERLVRHRRQPARVRMVPRGCDGGVGLWWRWRSRATMSRRRGSS